MGRIIAHLGDGGCRALIPDEEIEKYMLLGEFSIRDYKTKKLEVQIDPELTQYLLDNELLEPMSKN